MPTRHTVPVDGDEIASVHHESDGDGWIFFSHGFVSDKSGYDKRCEYAAEEGYDAVRFDHRGCGESSLTFAEQRLSTRIQDIVAVVGYFGPSSYVLFGSSFGGKVVFHAAAEYLDAVEAVVVRAPVTYNEPMERYRNDAADCVAEAFFEDLSGYGFSEVKDSLRAPVAFFHGRDDDVVPVEGSFEAAAEVDADAVVEAYAGESHRFSHEAEERLRNRAFRWLSTVRD